MSELVLLKCYLCGAPIEKGDDADMHRKGLMNVDFTWIKCSACHTWIKLCYVKNYDEKQNEP